MHDSVDKVVIPASLMDKSFNACVIKPQNYHTNGELYASLYLLHGYDNHYNTWLEKCPELQQWADEYNILIITPEAENSWYFDSPVHESYFATYITQDVRLFVEKHYHVSPQRKHRGITGISMGGHGAVYLALAHPELYEFVGSCAGALDLRASLNPLSIENLLGASLNDKEILENYSCHALIENFLKSNFNFIFDCGKSDHLAQANYVFRKDLLELNIPHHFYDEEGKHNWFYFRKSIIKHVKSFATLL